MSRPAIRIGSLFTPQPSMPPAWRFHVFGRIQSADKDMPPKFNLRALICWTLVGFWLGVCVVGLTMVSL